MTTDTLRQCFNEYDQFLIQHQHYWQLNPFATRQWPWPNSAEQIEQQLHDQLTSLPNPLQPMITGKDVGLAIPFWLRNGITGRKLAQIDGFLASFTSQHPVVEWCAGKGHLGRLLSFQHNLPVTSLEWQANLCAQGQTLAERFKLSQRFNQVNVMQLAPASLPTDSAVIALHACGDLHRRLLEQVTQSGCCELFLAPCCYHLQATHDYQPLSAIAAQSLLRLSKTDLKLAVQQFITAGQRTARLRHTEQLWRLVFEEYRTEVTGCDHYQPLPSLAKQLFSGELKDFMSWACAQQSLPEPKAKQVAKCVEQAKQRLLLVRALDQIRQLFRQPLEYWLLLDRALFLQQCGYQVRLQQFCDASDSPRNTLIIASKH
jgi:hypothetical protein